MYWLKIREGRISEYPIPKWQNLRKLREYLLIILGTQLLLNVHNIKKFSLEQIVEVRTGSRDMVMLFL